MLLGSRSIILTKMFYNLREGSWVFSLGKAELNGEKVTIEREKLQETLDQALRKVANARLRASHLDSIEGKQGERTAFLLEAEEAEWIAQGLMLTLSPVIESFMEAFYMSLGREGIYPSFSDDQLAGELTFLELMQNLNQKGRLQIALKPNKEVRPLNMEAVAVRPEFENAVAKMLEDEEITTSFNSHQQEERKTFMKVCKLLHDLGRLKL